MFFIHTKWKGTAKIEEVKFSQIKSQLFFLMKINHQLMHQILQK